MLKSPTANYSTQILILSCVCFYSHSLRRKINHVCNVFFEYIPALNSVNRINLMVVVLDLRGYYLWNSTLWECEAISAKQARLCLTKKVICTSRWISSFQKQLVDVAENWKFGFCLKSKVDLSWWELFRSFPSLEAAQKQQAKGDIASTWEDNCNVFLK